MSKIEVDRETLERWADGAGRAVNNEIMGLLNAPAPEPDWADKAALDYFDAATPAMLERGIVHVSLVDLRPLAAHFRAAALEARDAEFADLRGAKEYESRRADDNYDAFVKTERERDEARAEVKRLRVRAVDVFKSIGVGGTWEPGDRLSAVACMALDALRAALSHETSP